MATSKSTASNLPCAVAYLRKSTKGTTASGGERQAKSIAQQRKEIEKLAAGKYQIIRWYEDAGVSGWKTGADRPSFNAMLLDAKAKADFTVVLCDDLDRFSRAEVMEVFSDLSTLSAAGVNAVHCVNQGEYLLGDNDIGRIIKMVVDAHGGHDYSRKLSRRVALAKRNAAKDGKRSGGKAPYALKNDGKGGLVHGDPQQVKTVQWIFTEFNAGRSYNWLAGDLNRRKVPGPAGGKWSRTAISDLLSRECYAGNAALLKGSSGRFHGIDADGEVVETNGASSRRSKPTFTKAGAYKPIVSAKVYDAAQARRKTFKGGKRKPHDSRNGEAREVTYPLAGLLVCDHCGAPMYGCQGRGGSLQHTYRFRHLPATEPVPAAILRFGRICCCRRF